MTMPEGSRRGAINGFRQYLADNLLTVFERMPRLRKHPLELTYKLADKLADNGQERRSAHLRTANQGLKTHLSREASAAISLDHAPSSADQQEIAELIRWWMRHDPLGASRGVVEAVGLGGSFRLPEGDRQKLADAFLAMLGVDLSR
jgi:hypothetical protein